MKIMLLLAFIMSMSSNSYAQTDFGDKSFAIPPIDSNVKVIKNSTPMSRFPSMNFPPITPPSKQSSPFNNHDLPSNLKKIGQTSSTDFMQKEEFKNPGDIYEAKLNKREEKDVEQVFRKHQYLGDFKTKSAFVNILYRDHEYVDGDRIRVYINDILVRSEIILDENFQELEVTLKSGFNKIDFEAINQGSSGPNTAEFRVYDDKENLISANRWNLATGFKATVIIVKE